MWNVPLFIKKATDQILNYTLKNTKCKRRVNWIQLEILTNRYVSWKCIKIRLLSSWVITIDYGSLKRNIVIRSICNNCNSYKNKQDNHEIKIERLHHKWGLVHNDLSNGLKVGIAIQSSIGMVSSTFEFSTAIALSSCHQLYCSNYAAHCSSIFSHKPVPHS